MWLADSILTRSVARLLHDESPQYVTLPRYLLLIYVAPVRVVYTDLSRFSHDMAMETRESDCRRATPSKKLSFQPKRASTGPCTDVNENNSFNKS